MLWADVLYEVRDRVSDLPSPLTTELSLTPHNGNYCIATIHRPDNTDDPLRLAEIVGALATLDKPVVLLAHPRLIGKASEHEIDLSQGSLIACGPLAYPDLVGAILSSAGVVTDSSGLQKEAFLLRVPCTTVRPETEWVETIDLGWNQLANTADEISAAVQRPRPADTLSAPYGDGRTTDRVIKVLKDKA